MKKYGAHISVQAFALVLAVFLLVSCTAPAASSSTSRPSSSAPEIAAPSSSSSVAAVSIPAPTVQGAPPVPEDAENWQKLAYLTALSNAHLEDYSLLGLSITKPEHADMAMILRYQRQNGPERESKSCVWQLLSSGEAVLHYSGTPTFIEISNHTGLPFIQVDRSSTSYNCYVYKRGEAQPYYQYDCPSEEFPPPSFTITLPDGKVLTQHEEYYNVLVDYNAARMSKGLTLQTLEEPLSDEALYAKIHAFLFCPTSAALPEGTPAWIGRAAAAMKSEIVDINSAEDFRPTQITVLAPPVQGEPPMLGYTWWADMTSWQNQLGLWQVNDGSDSGWSFSQDDNGKVAFQYWLMGSMYCYTPQGDHLEFLFKSEVGPSQQGHYASIEDVYREFDSYEAALEWQDEQDQLALSQHGYVGKLRPLDAWTLDLPAYNSVEEIEPAIISALISWQATQP